MKLIMILLKSTPESGRVLTVQWRSHTDSVNTLQTIVPNLNENARVFTQIITELA